MSPLQPFIDKDLADAAPLDRDPLLLVEVVAQPVERPAGEGQAQGLGVGQCRGDHLGPLVLGVGARASGAGEVFEGGQPAIVEPSDPGRDGGPRDVQVQFVGDVTGGVWVPLLGKGDISFVQT